MRPSLPHLANPPIEEVVCGFVFGPLDLDAMDFGIYWDSRRDDFPRKELHPALRDFSGFKIGGAPPVRAWLVAESDDLLVQLQEDRFFLNWRRRDSPYPGFDNDDKLPAVLPRALEEYERFTEFCRTHIGPTPQLARIELTKINTLRKGRHYQNVEDLGQLLKVARVFEDIQSGSSSQLQLRLSEGQEQGAVHVLVVVQEQETRIESRTVLPATESLQEDFLRANARLNEIFFGLLNQDELARFHE